MGISNVLADALSMSVGEYLSNRSYNKYVLKELERETWCRTARRARGWRLHPHREICSTAAVCGPLPTHAVGLSLSALRAHCRVLRATRWVPRRRELENYPEGEINEMIALFESRGMSHADAKEVITRMAKYKTFFLNIMMTEELALPVPDDEDSIESLKDGFAMFLSFTICGMLPVLGFVIVPCVAPGLDDHTLFLFACFITAAALFGLGAFKAHFSDKRYMRSAVETVFLGGCCAAVAFLLGRLVEGFAREGSGALRHML
mmetsp:Transcript_40282/g.106133  ORF Transcript_40282/g.106133 Transcript_40282/m.106133 type:complete len:262 (-) Transcript_40282:482-1267(-)